MIKPNCKQCIYSLEQQLPLPNLGKQLFCVRYPPQVNVIQAQGGFQINSSFPPVVPLQFCGEFKGSIDLNS